MVIQVEIHNRKVGRIGSDLFENVEPWIGKISGGSAYSISLGQQLDDYMSAGIRSSTSNKNGRGSFGHAVR